MNHSHALPDRSHGGTIRSPLSSHSAPQRLGQSPAFTASSKMLWFIVLGLGTIFFLNEHDLTTSQRAQFSKSIEQQSVAVESGDTLRKICYLSLAGMGGVLLIRRYGQHLDYCNPYSVMIAVYLLYCIASVAWSIEPGLTIRRLAVLLLSIVGVLGVSRQIGMRDLLRTALLISGAIILVGLSAELALGTFQPWNGDYRFSGTVHPNSQASNCAVFVMAAYCIAALNRGTLRKWWLLVMAAGILLMLLTKSRTGFAAMTIGLFALWIPSSSTRSKAVLAVGVPFLGSMALWFAALGGYDVGDLVSQFTLMGRAEQVTSLSGRVPLWTELAPYASDRFFLGHGYNTFWNSWHISEISNIFEWTIPNAHNELLDSLLNVGLLGTLLLVLIVIMGLFRTGLAYLRTGDPGIGFVYSLVVFGVVVSLFESGFSHPVSFESFLAACGITLVAFCHADRTPFQRMPHPRLQTTMDPTRRENDQ